MSEYVYYRERVAELQHELDRQGAAIARVRALHVPRRVQGAPVDVCDECDGRNWPCPTIAALGGEP